MGEVFGTPPENVVMHLRNTFASEELAEQATTKDILVVQTEGKRRVRRTLKHYNLDAIAASTVAAPCWHRNRQHWPPSERRFPNRPCAEDWRGIRQPSI